MNWKAEFGEKTEQAELEAQEAALKQELSEIAAATGLSEGTVKAHLSRAVARVRLELGGKR